MTEFLVCIDNK